MREPKIIQSILRLRIFNMTLLLLLLLLLAGIANAYVDVEISGERCLENGQFTFIAQNKYEEPLKLNELKILMFHKRLGEFSARGSWDKEFISAQTLSSKSSKYTSA